MLRLNWPARAYVIAVWCAGAAAALLLYPTVDWQPETSVYVLLLAVLHFWMGTGRVVMPTGMSYSFAALVSITALLVFGPAIAAAANALSLGLERHRPLYRRVFDIASPAIALAAAWRVFTALGGSTEAGMSRVAVAPGLAAGFVYTYLMWLVAIIAAAIERRARLLPMLRYSSPGVLVFWPAGAVLLAPAFDSGVWVGFTALALAGALAYLYGQDEGRTRKAAQRDSVTGLFNHMFLHRRLAELTAESRSGTPLALAMVDIIGFKAFNDRHGHAAGDRVLAGLGAEVARQVRWPSLGARYGGDKLLLLLVGAQAGSAEALCEHLSGHLARLPAPVPADLAWGIARAPADGWHKNELLTAAAERLYRAKNAERMRQQERLRRVERLSALGQMAAALAHEVRNPLTAVQGFLQLQAHRLDPETHGLITAELDRMAALVGEFLSLARPAPAPAEAVDVTELVRGAARLGEVLAHQFESSLEVRVPPELPQVAGHPERLRQVLLNLLKNAFEAAPGGAVVLEAGATAGELWIAVSDNGPGVPPELAERIFDPFFTTKAAGSGLGLTLSHQIVHDLGGRLELEPNPGGGARFVVYLRLYAR